MRLARDPVGTLDRHRARFGPTFRLPLLPVAGAVVLTEPECVRQMLFGDPDVYRAGAATLRLLSVLGRGSLLAADGPVHGSRRELMMGQLRAGRIADRASEIDAVAEREVARWPVVEPTMLLPRARDLAWAVLARIVGRPRDAGWLEEARRRLARLLGGYGTLALWIPRLQSTAPLSPGRTLRRRWDELDSLIAENVSNPVRGAEDGLLATLAASCPHAGHASVQDVVDEVRALLIVGHETTATGIAWTLDLLARNPEIVDRVHRGEPEIEERVVSEALRLRPPVIDTVRALGAPTLVGGYELPTDTMLLAAPSVVHRDPTLYSDHERFDPDRFADSTPDPARWLPFGGGVRRCAGAALARHAMASTVHAAARRYAMRPARVRPERARLLGTSMVPRHGVELVLEARG